MNLRVYTGTSHAEFHRVLSDAYWNKTQLKEFFLSFPPQCLLPWNEYKRKYKPNNPYQVRLTDQFKMIYAPNWEGKELIEYPIIQKIISQFNFEQSLLPTDVQLMAYDPGFEFQRHLDVETNVNIMFPIIPDDGGEPLTFWNGNDKDNPDSIAYKMYYSPNHPTLTDGKIIHSVDKVENYRVYLRVRTGGETYNDIINKHNRGEFIIK